MDTYFNNEENKENKETIENKEIKKNNIIYTDNKIFCETLNKLFEGTETIPELNLPIDDPDNFKISDILTPMALNNIKHSPEYIYRKFEVCFVKFFMMENYFFKMELDKGKDKYKKTKKNKSINFQKTNDDLKEQLISDTKNIINLKEPMLNTTENINKFQLIDPNNKIFIDSHQSGINITENKINLKQPGPNDPRELIDKNDKKTRKGSADYRINIKLKLESIPEITEEKEKKLSPQKKIHQRTK